MELYDRLHSLRQTSAELERAGYTGPHGKPYSAKAVRSMIGAERSPERVAQLMGELSASIGKAEPGAKGSATMPLDGSEKVKEAKKVTRR